MEASTSRKVKGINVITYSINDDIHMISAAISLQNEKVLDEPISKQDTKEKQSNDSI